MTLDEAMERLQLMHDLACAAGWTNKSLGSDLHKYRAWLHAIAEVWCPICGHMPVWITREGTSPYLHWNGEPVYLTTWRKQREQQSQTDD